MLAARCDIFAGHAGFEMGLGVVAAGDGDVGEVGGLGEGELAEAGELEDGEEGGDDEDEGGVFGEEGGEGEGGVGLAVGEDGFHAVGDGDVVGVDFAEGHFFGEAAEDEVEGVPDFDAVGGVEGAVLPCGRIVR